MAHVWKDRCLETSTSTGTGNFTLAGAVTGFRTFASVCSTNDTVYYFIEAVDSNGIPTGDWETGLGTYSASNTLTRTTVLDSSNSGSAVSFSSGTKRVGLCSPARTARGYEAETVTPVVANFSLENAGTASIADGAYGIDITSPQASTNIRFARYTGTTPSSWTVIARLVGHNLFNGGNYTKCLIFRNSTNSRILIFGHYNNTQILAQRWTSYTAFSANALSPTSGPVHFPWFKAVCNGTTINFYASMDGVKWALCYTETISTFLTASGGGTVDQVGFGQMVLTSGGYDLYDTCHHFAVS